MFNLQSYYNLIEVSIESNLKFIVHLPFHCTLYLVAKINKHLELATLLLRTNPI